LVFKVALVNTADRRRNALRAPELFRQAGWISRPIPRERPGPGRLPPAGAFLCEGTGLRAVACYLLSFSRSLAVICLALRMRATCGEPPAAGPPVAKPAPGHRAWPSRCRLSQAQIQGVRSRCSSQVPGSGRPRCGDRATPGPSAPRPSHAGIGSRGSPSDQGRSEMFGSRQQAFQTFGVRLRTFAFARSTLPCNFLRSTTAAGLVGKKLLARRRVWPLRTYHSKEPSAHVCLRT
jgi:hypothetical protein